MNYIDERKLHNSSPNPAVPSAPYQRRAPSPPFIRIPPSVEKRSLALRPNYENVDPTQLTIEDLQIITRNAVQPATDMSSHWRYEQRREAQPILDFLWLGPTSIVRDHAFLDKEKITLVVVARDVRMAGRRLMSAERAAEQLGIAVSYVDVTNPQQLLSCFPQTIRLINDHLIRLFHLQCQSQATQSAVGTGTMNLPKGNVLITCDTGNDLSGAIVAAYIMTVFGKKMAVAAQYINLRRFCCSFDEEVKRALQTWEDLLKARSTVAQQRQQNPPHTSTARSKRRIDDTIDSDESEFSMVAHVHDDEERFAGRESFVPFRDY